MSRENKFRAWDDYQKKMYSWSELGEMNSKGYLCLWNLLIRHNSQLIPLEYTGLSDKNGVEIYEGDLVKTFTDGEEYILEITFTVDRDFNGWEITPQHIEDGAYVIGNIHENPELLTP